jgi:hypothetical protein
MRPGGRLHPRSTTAQPGLDILLLTLERVSNRAFSSNPPGGKWSGRKILEYGSSSLVPERRPQGGVVEQVVVNSHLS